MAFYDKLEARGLSSGSVTNVFRVSQDCETKVILIFGWFDLPFGNTGTVLTVLE
jgi:hypothetical protein